VSKIPQGEDVAKEIQKKRQKISIFGVLNNDRLQGALVLEIG